MLDIIREIQILFDFGLVVLIWLVQLVIYPSFLYFSKENLLKWHENYTIKITLVVMPLMVGQLCLAVYITSVDFMWEDVLIVILILSIWLNTFLQAVPLHQKIATHNFTNQTIVKLLKVNRVRTALWTLVFLVNLAKMLIL